MLRTEVNGPVMTSSPSLRPVSTSKYFSPAMPVSVGMSMNEIERAALEATLRSVGYDKQRAAKILGIGLRTLYRKQKEYGL